MIEIKERPILMSGEEVKAILAGKKTQTRRIATFIPLKREGKINLGFSGISAGDYSTGDVNSGKVLYSRRGDGCWEQRTERAFCPYGTVGDRLWVRETYQVFYKDTDAEAYKRFIAGQNIKTMDDLIEWGKMPSGHGELGILYAADFGDWAYNVDSDLQPWRPSIFMPRKYSRILLEITNIRVQRIQDITDEEAMAEGCPSERVLDTDGKSILYSGLKPTYWFEELWDSIYAKRGHGWDKNDWVWVIEFKKVEEK
jgi:hypothetical protein